MKEKFLSYIEQHPEASQADAARHFGVTRQRISQLCKSEGVVLRRPSRHDLRRAPREFKTINGRARDRFVGAANNTLIGATSEIAVCLDLMDRGFYVYRALAPNSPCDLVAIKDGITLRIEVKTSRFDRTGNVVRPNNFPDRYDVLACVVHGPEIYYFRDGQRWEPID